MHLRKVTLGNFHEWISLEVNEAQKRLVATVKLLAEAKVNPNLFPLAIYDAAAGYKKPQFPMVGFTM